MKKKAIISVKSVQNNNDKECIEVVTPGELHVKKSGFEAWYDETEISGMKGTKTKLYINNDYIKLNREGTTTTQMEFKKEESSVSLYNTPYGMLELRIDTNDIKIDMSDNGGDVTINYDLSVEGQESQNTELKINIRA